MLGIAIMMNNYAHDLATALLATSGITLLVFARRVEHDPSAEVRAYFVDTYDRLTRLGMIAFVWIMVGGAVRARAYEEFEWVAALGNGQVYALIVKHIILVGVVGIGIAAWWRLRSRVAKMRAAAAAPRAV